MRKQMIALAFFAGFALALQAQRYQANWPSLETRPLPAWFQQDKFGIFIHWGVYSVPSYSLVVPDGYAEWYWCNYKDSSRHNHKAVTSFHNKVYGADFAYEQFVPMFKAELFNPDQWANIFLQSGAKYVVLTSKHHEGFTLWPSKEADASWGRPWNAVSAGPKRDLLGELTTAVKKSGLKMGYYYSLMEWYNPLFTKDPARYVTEVMMPQLKDLVTKYQPSLIFADGEWRMPDTAWRSTEFLAWLYNESPVKNTIVVNDRWGKNTRKTHPGTYYTSEYGSGLGKNVAWEESRGMGQSYGYNRMERLGDYKSADELILILADIVSKGGNLLLDIGPAADGTIPVIMEERLLQMGEWLKINGEAIYGSSSHTKDRQWSSGKIPAVKAGEYQTGYDISEMVRPKGNDTAYIEMLYTKKGHDLYCIVPNYTPYITIRALALPAGASLQVLGVQKKISWKQTGTDVLVNLSGLNAADVPAKIFTIKITNAVP